MTPDFRLVVCGDRTLLVYAGDRIDPGINDQVHALARALAARRHPAVVEITPSYHCLMIEFDPVRLRPEQLEEMVREASQDLDAHRAEARTVEIPVCYGQELGPDLNEVAALTDLAPEEVVRRHADGLYRVYCLGFSPGFPYLGGLDPALEVPRLADPRIKVPGGSVGIAGKQTGIYPAPSPGGWRLIGRTPLRLFDPWREPPALLEPGDLVRFVPVSPEEYERLAAESPRARPALPTYAEGPTGIRVLQPGMATTIQDLGRRGHMRYGVPVAGAADFWSLMVGNWLLGNRARTAALEITLTGPEVEFTGPAAFCLTGAPIQAELIPADGSSPRTIPGWTAWLAGPGDRLRLGAVTAGCRSYLCVGGGIDLPPVLGSLSEDLFGHLGPLGRPLQAGDWLPIGLPLHPPADLAGRSLPSDAIPDYTRPVIIRATRGPQAGAFHEEAVAAFFTGAYEVGPQSDRQGLRLQGPVIHHQGQADILSEPIPPGSVQVPANGQPILLLGNRQTIGGYAKVAVAVYPDLAAAAQLRPGDRVRFQEVDLSEAHAIAWAERRRLGQIRRYLERYASRAPRERSPVRSMQASTASEAIPDPRAAPPRASASGPKPPAAVRQVRTYRITIGGVEYQALVEEVDRF